MESQALRSAVRRLRQVVSAPPAGPDAELLRAFANRRDAGAFEQIVRRHGPMVLGVCRRVLRDAADADDAFQATFLVLVRKAGSLRAPDRLAGWLHQVAHRVARKARALRLNRARRQGELFDVPAGEPPAEILWRELRPIFDAELDRLPDRLRLPAVLCLLEGHSKADAARMLGWPMGTLSCRLQRARERLRARLAARGLTLSAGVLAVALFEGAGSAAVPDRLIASTIQSLTTAASGAAARALADGVTQAMFLAKIKTVAAAVLVVGVVGTGTGVALVPGSGRGAVQAAEPEKGPPAKQVSPPPRASADTKAVPGEPVDVDRPVQRQVQELELLKERLAWEERMVKKGFMAESQVTKTRLEVARAEAALAKAEAPKAPDPRRTILEAAITRQEQILQQERDGVARGAVQTSELDAVEYELHELKLKLLELPDRPTDESRVRAVAAERQAMITIKEREIARIEANRLKQRLVSAEEVTQLRVDLGKLRAEAATAAGDYPAAVKLRESVVAELESAAALAQVRFDRKTSPRSDLSAAELALAEARIETLKAGVRQQLASIVASREEELRELRALHELKAASSDDVRRAELALAQARARLAAER